MHLMRWNVNISALTNEEREQITAQTNEDNDHKTVAGIIAEVTGRHVVLAERKARKTTHSRIRVNAYDYEEDMEFSAPFDVVQQWNQG